MTRTQLVRSFLFSVIILVPLGFSAQVVDGEGGVSTGDEVIPPEVSELEAGRIIELLRQEAMVMGINANVYSPEDEVMWTHAVNEITVLGKQVQVRIHGQNLTIEANFTVFRQGDGALMLLAQGQSWVQTPGTNSVQYQTAIRSLSITLGEPVLFYPLGLDLTSESMGKAVLELEVTVQSLAYVLGYPDESPASVRNNSEQTID